jgi:hypothetical protein
MVFHIFSVGQDRWQRDPVRLPREHAGGIQPVVMVLACSPNRSLTACAVAELVWHSAVISQLGFLAKLLMYCSETQPSPTIPTPSLPCIVLPPHAVANFDRLALLRRFEDGEQYLVDGYAFRVRRHELLVAVKPIYKVADHLVRKPRWRPVDPRLNETVLSDTPAFTATSRIVVGLDLILIRPLV